MRTRNNLIMATLVLLSASLFSGCMTMVPSRTVITTNYENPQWAPPYYSGARYYYLPDLELYYDLSTRNYIFLMDDRWHFSPYVPAMYQNYDLDNSFCIVLNIDVYRPWMHHQYYASHYPRYYYRDYYDRSNIPYVRAYNENLRRAIYWREHERNRARPWNDENLRNNRRFKYSKEDLKEQRNQTQGQRTFGGESRDEQQTRTTTRTETTTQPRTTTRTENRFDATPQTRTSTRTETRTQERSETKSRSEATPRTKTSTRTETRTPATRTTTTRETATEEKAAPARNNQTNNSGKDIGRSVRVTKQMKEVTPTSRTGRQTSPSR